MKRSEVLPVKVNENGEEADQTREKVGDDDDDDDEDEDDCTTHEGRGRDWQRENEGKQSGTGVGAPRRVGICTRVAEKG